MFKDREKSLCKKTVLACLNERNRMVLVRPRANFGSKMPFVHTGSLESVPFLGMFSVSFGYVQK